MRTPTFLATALCLVSSAAAAQHPGDRWVDSVLATLSLRDRAAQMVWPNLMADYVAADAPQWRHLSAYVSQEHVGGLLMSVGSPIEMAAKLNDLQRMSPLPLLVGADLETGAGMRARGGYFVPNGIDLGGGTLFPPNMAIGATRDTTLAYDAGWVTAIEGRALGIQVDFAPVLDVNNNSANPVINTRSYGEDPHAVARLGAAFIRGLQDHGMIATGKHFPGHGDTGTNSHLALPVVTVSRARLDTVELVPFEAAIHAGVGAIMTFHGSMPALDSSGVPGTLSPLVITTLLRQHLNFSGLVVSDAMDMRGVLDQYGATESVKRAVAAGVDVLIQPLDVHATIDAITAGVAEHRYSEDRITEAARKILTLKHHLDLDRQRLVDLDQLRLVVGDSANVAVAQTVADRSITVLRDSLHLLPIAPASTPKILSITIAHRADLAAGTTFDAELRHTAPALHTEFIDADDPAPNYPRLSTLADSADLTIISSYVGQSWNALTANAPQAFAEWVTHVTAGHHRVIVAAFGNPYLLQQIPTVPEYVIAWGGAPVSQLAAASALTGAIPVVGHSPISIPPLVHRGAGLTIGARASISPPPAATH
ncbi:MAG TPA: glycoside hydrolase family 3 N-terminal domain-containing protein [Gemmatimonadaceae bacterium]|jgi:beta-N-acetylhexosaminidase|nr:glycoside hydrolase family 3 N-terminal domain-containing protein [Gemmatimonadaceae bacterium]